jgi:hypothetical protein
MMNAINSEGSAFLSQTIVGGKHFAIRVAVGNLRSQSRHLEALWARLKELSAAD